MIWRRRYGDDSETVKRWVEVLRRSGDSGAQIRYTLFSDWWRSVCRSSGDAENQTENGVACAGTEVMNRAGEKIERKTKSSASRGRVWNETGRQSKSSGRRNGLTDKAERGMRFDERRAANTIGRTRTDLSDRSEQGIPGRWNPEGHSATNDRHSVWLIVETTVTATRVHKNTNVCAIGVIVPTNVCVTGIIVLTNVCVIGVIVATNAKLPIDQRGSRPESRSATTHIHNYAGHFSFWSKNCI
jgi:hypothetical protein